MTRKSIPSMIRKKLTQESQSTCPFCGEDDVSTAQFHHITPVAEGGSNSSENLIYICANCHSKVTQGQISRDEIMRVKQMLVRGEHPQLKGAAESNIIRADFSRGSNRGVIANRIERVEIRTGQKSVNINPPDGSIGSSLPHRNYAKHLIDRYHEFKTIDVGKEGMKHAILYQY
ncbi:MAG: HNH endonuclease, partial [Alphaproteobacteria bacterium]|nr:HNH endonuclease [Alphaproteobacteria bacterium]